MRKALNKIVSLVLIISIIGCLSCLSVFAEEKDNFLCSTLGHLYTYKITKATSKADGVITSTCLRCGHVSDETIKRPVLVCQPSTMECTGSNLVPSVTGLDWVHFDATYPKESKLPGTYTVDIRLRGLYYSGTTTVKYKINLRKPTIVLSQEQGKRNVIISNFQVPGAEKYIIYHYKKVKSKWKYVDKITVKKTEEYKKNVKLKKNTQHRYKVKAIAKNSKFTATSDYMSIKVK